MISQASVDEATILIRCLVTPCCILFHLFPNNHRSIYHVKGSHPHPYLIARWLCNEVMDELGKSVQNTFLSLESLTWASASLSCNFQLPAHWQLAFQDDFNEQTHEVYFDLTYEKMLKLAQQWQHKLWKEFAPLYPQK